jgi:hypothetical protein
MKYAPEDTRRHGTEVEDRQLPGGASRPHPSATQPPTEGFLYALTKTFLHRLLGCMSTVREIGLIQGLTILP